MSLQNIDGSYNVTMQATANVAGATSAGPIATPTTITCFPLANGYELSVAMEPNQILWDDYGTGTLDVINRWNAGVTGGGGNATAATNAVGNTVLGSGTTASGFSYLQSQFSFPGRNPGYLFAQLQTQVEASPVLTNAYRFWGFATIPATPTAALPLSNAVGFEIGINGKMAAITFASGGRILIKDLSSTGNNTQPLDGATHKYEIFFRGDNILWYIDAVLVATTITGALGPDVNTLNLSFLTVANTTGPTSSATIISAQVTVGDTSRNAQRIVDGTYNWRSAMVTPQGQQVVGNLTPGTPITNSATGTTAAITATLAGVANKTTYITGLVVTTNNPTAATNSTVTVAGTVSGSLVYGLNTEIAAAATPQPAPLVIQFSSPIPASAVNTAISVTLSALGAGGVGQVNVTGFQL